MFFIYLSLGEGRSPLTLFYDSCLWGIHSTQCIQIVTLGPGKAPVAQAEGGGAAGPGRARLVSCDV